MNISYDLTLLPIVLHIGHGVEGLGIPIGGRVNDCWSKIRISYYLEFLFSEI